MANQEKKKKSYKGRPLRKPYDIKEGRGIDRLKSRMTEESISKKTGWEEDYYKYQSKRIKVKPSEIRKKGAKKCKAGQIWDMKLQKCKPQRSVKGPDPRFSPSRKQEAIKAQKEKERRAEAFRREYKPGGEVPKRKKR